jgi:hypothetical protein
MSFRNNGLISSLMDIDRTNWTRKVAWSKDWDFGVVPALPSEYFVAWRQYYMERAIPVIREHTQCPL